MGWKLDDLNPKFRQQAEAQLAGHNPRRHAEGEPDCERTPEAVKVTPKDGGATVQQDQERAEGRRFTGPVAIKIIHHRKRLADGDGYFVKSALDALVDAGILPGDGPEVIPQPPVQEHYKVETFEDERTEIIIEEI